MSTLDIEQFANKDMASIYQCTVCTEIAIDPKEHTGTGACEAIYCRVCTEKILKQDEPKCGLRCPAAFTETSMRDLRRSSKAIHEALLFTCPYCQDIIKIEQITKHREVCLLFPNPPGITKGTMTEKTSLYSNLISYTRQSKVKNIRLCYDGVEETARADTNSDLKITFSRAKALSGLKDNHMSVVMITHQVLRLEQKIQELTVHGYTAYINIIDNRAQRWDKTVSLVYNNNQTRSVTPQPWGATNNTPAISWPSSPPALRSGPAEHILEYDIEGEW